MGEARSTRRGSEDAPHRLGGYRRKVAKDVSVLGFLNIHQTDVGVMDQGSRLQSLKGLFIRQFGCGELSKFFLDRRQERFGRAQITVLNL